MKRALLPALLLAAALWGLGVAAPARPARSKRAARPPQPPPVVVPSGAQVILVFDQALSSKTAQVGQVVRLHVASNLFVGERLVIRAGTPVRGIVEDVSHRKRYGVNASLHLAVEPVRSIHGTPIPLAPRSVGRQVGKKTGVAGAATVGGAAILGPLGLAGGYFVHGKPVSIPAGAVLDTQVVHNTVVR
jgi:hypothetical protein